LKGMGFSVATNFRPDFVDEVACYPEVTEVFGKLSRDPVGGGRASFMLAPVGVKAFKEHVAALKARGKSFNYLLNPACMDNREYTSQGQRDIMRVLDFVDECGIEAVTISLPFLLPVIKSRYPKLKVRVGVYARVDSVAKARFWEDMGADCITLESISVNRDFSVLENIRRAVGIELQLIANSNCMMFCPLSGQHMVNLSHASQKGHKSRGFMIDYCVLKCSCEKLKDPSHYLRSEFIRPEDLWLYREMGYNSFKILERGAPTSVMAKRVKAYSEGKFEGNLLELIQPFGYAEETQGGLKGRLNFWRYFIRPGAVRLSKLHALKKLAAKRGMLAPLEGAPVYLDNSALHGFLAGMMEKDCRSTDCKSCGYCAAYARKALTVDEAYRDEMLGLYEAAFGDMYSGSLWGIG